jgi:hypothetical protein
VSRVALKALGSWPVGKQQAYMLSELRNWGSAAESPGRLATERAEGCQRQRRMLLLTRGYDKVVGSFILTRKDILTTLNFN